MYWSIFLANGPRNSNKLAENVGGSKLAADIFKSEEDEKKKTEVNPPGGLLQKVIDKVTQQPAYDWRGGEKLNPALRAEIIYQGGGNAFIALTAKKKITTSRRF